MSVQARPEKLKQSKWWEIALRFAFGGLCTVIAGLVAKRFGPAAGGLFLAFPAIFPSGASLIASHEKERKHRAGMHGTHRGCQLAGVDAAGATMGCLGLAAFAIVAWQELPRHNAALVIAAASVAWAAVSFAVWWAWRKRAIWRRRSR